MTPAKPLPLGWSPTTSTRSPVPRTVTRRWTRRARDRGCIRPHRRCAARRAGAGGVDASLAQKWPAQRAGSPCADRRRQRRTARRRTRPWPGYLNLRHDTRVGRRVHDGDGDDTVRLSSQTWVMPSLEPEDASGLPMSTMLLRCRAAPRTSWWCKRVVGRSLGGDPLDQVSMAMSTPAGTDEAHQLESTVASVWGGGMSMRRLCVRISKCSRGVLVLVTGRMTQ